MVMGIEMINRVGLANSHNTLTDPAA